MKNKALKIKTPWNELITLTLISVFTISLSIHGVYADIYKCTGEDGVVRFSDEPCGENSEFAFKSAGGIQLIENALVDFHVSESGRNLTEKELNYISAIRKHARYVGGHIFHDLQLISERKDTSSSRIALDYGSSNSTDRYTVTIYYDRNKNEDGILFDKIIIEKNGRYFVPEIMAGTKRLKQYSTGWWDVY